MSLHFSAKEDPFAKNEVQYNTEPAVGWQNQNQVNRKIVL